MRTQEKTERNEQIVRLVREDKLSYRKVGEMMGISHARVGIIMERQKRREQQV